MNVEHPNRYIDTLDRRGATQELCSRRCNRGEAVCCRRGAEWPRRAAIARGVRHQYVFMGDSSEHADPAKIACGWGGRRRTVRGRRLEWHG